MAVRSSQLRVQEGRNPLVALHTKFLAAAGSPCQVLKCGIERASSSLPWPSLLLPPYLPWQELQAFSSYPWSYRWDLALPLAVTFHR